MKNIIITTASLNLIANDPAYNLDLIKKSILQAVTDGAGILVLPELTLTSYDAGNAFNSHENVNINTLKFLKQIADFAKVCDPNLMISVGHILQIDRPNEHPHTKDSAVICQSYLLNGQLVAVQTKTDIANNYNNACTGPEYESRYFKSWPPHQFSYYKLKDIGIKSAVSQAALRNFYPDLGVAIGDVEAAFPVGNNEYALIKTLICESAFTGLQLHKNANNEIEYLIDPETQQHSSLLGRSQLKLPFSIILIPNGSPPATGKIKKRKALVQAIANYSNALVVYVNAVGSPQLSLCFEGDKIFANKKVMAVGERFSFRLMSHHSEFANVQTYTSNDLVMHPSTIVAQNVLTLTPATQEKLEQISQENNSRSYIEGNVHYRSLFDTTTAHELDYKIIRENMRSSDQVYTMDELISNAAQHSEEMFLHDALYFLDYMTKNKMETCFISLSGGYDSTYTLLVGCAAIDLAFHDYIYHNKGNIGHALKQFFDERFDYHIQLKLSLIEILSPYFQMKSPDLNDCILSLDEITNHELKCQIIKLILDTLRKNLFSTAYIATNTSSYMTETAAHNVTSFLGVPFRKIDIQSSVEEAIFEFLLPQSVTVSDVDTMATYYATKEPDIQKAISAQLFRGRQGLIAQVIEADEKSLQNKTFELSKHLYKICWYLINFWKTLYAKQPNEFIQGKIQGLELILNSAQKSTNNEGYLSFDLAQIPSWGNSEKMRLNLENLQARLRAVINWFINSMLPKKSTPTCNANLSETIRGYTTFCGDEHAGTFSVTSHRNKCDIMMIMLLLHKKGIQISNDDFNNSVFSTCTPLDCLKYIFEIPPSAELQPLKNGFIQQTDEDAFKMSYFELRLIMEELFFTPSSYSPNFHQAPSTALSKLMKAEWAILKWPNEFDRLQTLVAEIYSSYTSFYHAQFKIRALPIGPVYDSNVNQHISLRTPNASGHQKGECMAMVIDSVFNYLDKKLNPNTIINAICSKSLEGYAVRAWFGQQLLFDFSFQNLIETLFKHYGLDMIQMANQLNTKIQLILSAVSSDGSSLHAMHIICLALGELAREHNLPLNYNPDLLKQMVSEIEQNYKEEPPVFTNLFFQNKQIIPEQLQASANTPIQHSMMREEKRYG